MGEDEWYIAMYAAPSAKLIDLAIAGHVPHFAAFVTFDAAPIRADRGCRGALAGHMSDALASEALCLQNGRTIPGHVTETLTLVALL